MTTSTTSIESTPSVHRERLQQAKRVMHELSSRADIKFCIGVYARKSEQGIEACIAGLCGLDPWFQDRGFVTHVATDSDSIGYTNILPEHFFGTGEPFYPGWYRHDPATVEDAIAALDEAIARIDS